MKFRWHFSFIFLFLFIGISASKAGKLEKAFERLNVYDYFNAKKYFEKCLNNETAAAAFGLSKMYSSVNNPFYNPDEAWKYIHIADSAFKQTKEKVKKYYAGFGINEATIVQLNELICEEAFLKCSEKPNVEAYEKYIRDFLGCFEISQAYILRDSLAFVDASIRNTAAGYKEYMTRYPESKEFIDAGKKYDERSFVENTIEDDLEAYENFIKNYPENPYRPEAEAKIFRLSVPDSTIEQYTAFVRKYKSIVDTKDAWNALYKLFMRDYTMETYNNFKDSFPDFPFPDELEKDFKLQNFVFLPFTEKGLWGYINEYGQRMMEPEYDEANFFSERLAAVSKDGKYGFINKSGEVVVNLKYNDVEAFHYGAAIVLEDSLYGLINRQGEFLIPPDYEELSETGGDLYIASVSGKYGYLHKIGGALTRFEFDIARDFKNNLAIVSIDEKYGIINSKAEYILSPQYEELNFINDTLLKASNEEELWGIVSIHGDTLLPFVYDAIGDFSCDRALVAKNDKCGYVDSSGRIAIPLSYYFSPGLLNSAQFQEGYALLKQKNKSVLVDSTGKVKKFQGYEDYQRPSHGLIPVKKNKRWGYADMNGKLQINCKYEFAYSFVDTLAVITQNNESGLIDTAGNVFIQPLYQEIKVVEKAILVRKNNLWGLLSRSGILYLPCRYQKIEFVSPEIAQARDENGYTYINLRSGKIIYSSKE